MYHFAPRRQRPSAFVSPAVADKRLHHLTLNTGHVTLLRCPKIRGGELDALRAIADTAAGPVPKLKGWYLDFWFPQKEDADTGAVRRIHGVGAFQIASAPNGSTLPAVMCVACMRDDFSANAWAQAMDTYSTMEDVLRMCRIWTPAPQECPPAPWLAVILMPSLVLADQDNVRMFGNLERCVAWALADY